MAESPRPIPRSKRPPESSWRTARLDAVTDGSRVAGLVTQVPRRSVVVAWAISVRSGYGSRHRTWRVEEPAVGEAGRLGLPRERDRPLDRVVGLDREAELHRSAPPSPAPLRSDQVAVRLGAPVAVELPGLADLRDQLEVHVPDEQLLVVRAGRRRR